MPNNHSRGRPQLIVHPGARKMLESSKVLEQVTQSLLDDRVAVDIALAYPTVNTKFIRHQRERLRMTRARTLIEGISMRRNFSSLR